MKWITEKPCIAHLRDGTWAKVDLLYPESERPLLGLILKGCPSEKDGYRFHIAENPYYSWLPDGRVVSCNEHNYDIMETSPLPQEYIADAIEELRLQNRLLVKKEAVTRAYCNELRALAAEIVRTDDKEAFDKLYALATRPL